MCYKMLMGTSNNSMNIKQDGLRPGRNFCCHILRWDWYSSWLTYAVFVVRNPYQHRVVFFSAVYGYCLEKTHLRPTFHPLLRPGKEVVLFSVTLNNKLIKTYFNKFNNLKSNDALISMINTGGPIANYSPNPTLTFKRLRAIKRILAHTLG